jgi:hypothetical protein
MKIEYNNLYTHYVFTTLGRHFMIPKENWIRIEKYITDFEKIRLIRFLRWGFSSGY